MANHDCITPVDSCAVCGASLSAKQRWRRVRFCSRACSASSRSTCIPRTCIACGKSFSAKAKKVAVGCGQLCSAACRNKHNGIRGPKILDTQARFWSRVNKSGGEDACWEWMAGCYPDGYGAFKFGPRNRGSHVLAWFFTYGPIEHGMHILHECDNPPCCNPAHLRVGTNEQNVADKMEKGRQARGSKCATKPRRGTLPPGPLKGVTGHGWQALAVAVTASETGEASR